MIRENVATKSDLAEVRQELKADIAELRSELKADIAGVRGEIGGLRHELTMRGIAALAAWATILFTALHLWPPHG